MTNEPMQEAIERLLLTEHKIITDLSASLHETTDCLVEAMEHVPHPGDTGDGDPVEGFESLHHLSIAAIKTARAILSQLEAK